MCVFFVVQIAEIRISFDGGATSLNFAEAALLIQGSACIYSRKVRAESQTFIIYNVWALWRATCVVDNRQTHFTILS